VVYQRDFGKNYIFFKRVETIFLNSNKIMMLFLSSQTDCSSKHALNFLSQL